MNLYITFDNKEKIKKAFLNLRKYVILSAPEIVENLGYSLDNLDECSNFIINREIKNQIIKGASRKKVYALIYSNPDLDDLKIRELINYCQQNVDNIEAIFFLVEKGRYEEYYELFDGVTFYPYFKKVHILECATVPVEIAVDKTSRDYFLSQS